MSISSSSIFSNYKFLIQPPTPEYKDFSSPSNYWAKIGPSYYFYQDVYTFLYINLTFAPSIAKKTFQFEQYS